MNALIEAAGIPEHIRGILGKASNKALIAGASIGFPVLSFRGKAWAVQRGDDREVIRRKNGDPVSSLDVIIVEASERISKVYYASGYESGSTDAPDCTSVNGIVPDPGVQSPQSATCATCPHNVWGSRVTERGASRGKACADVRRLAVARKKDPTELMLLRVPPTSLRSLAHYGAELDKLGVPFWAVVTKVSFDPNAEYPQLAFSFSSWVEHDALTSIQAIRTGDPVMKAILGTAESLALPAPAPEQAALPAPAPAEPAAKAKPRPAVPPKPAPVEDDDDDGDEEEDAPAVVAPPKPALKRAPKREPEPVAVGQEPKTVAFTDLPSELRAALDSLTALSAESSDDEDDGDEEE